MFLFSPQLLLRWGLAGLRKRAGFVGMRGRRAGFVGMRGKKAGFVGMRG